MLSLSGNIADTRKAKLLIDSTVAVWVEQDPTAIDTYFKSDVAVSGVLQDGSLSADDFREFIPVIAALLKDIRVEPLVVTEYGDWAQMLYKCSANTVTGHNPINVVSQLTVRFSGDKIAECYDTFDYLKLFEQAKQLPEHTLERLFSGESLLAESM